MSSGASRGILAGWLDKLTGHLLGLPPEESSYSVERLQIPLPDGVQLVADLYRPVNFKPLGTILIRSPYGLGLPDSLFGIRVFAARGYQILANCCRGTFEAGGEFEPGRNEAADGHAVVEWMREQSWYTGSFATVGASYLGYNQWALLSDPPDDMKAAVVWTGLHSFANFIWGTGALSSNIVAWADIQRRLRSDSLISIIMALRSQKQRLQPVLDALPLLPAVETFFAGEPPQWLRHSLTNPNLQGEYWTPMKQDSALDKANIPILLTTGFDDLILAQIMEQYEKLSKRGCQVALTIGPWTHLGAQARNTAPESLDWLNEHLGHTKSAGRRSPVRVYVTGLQVWRDLQSWPPEAENQELYLSSGRKLLRDLPGMEDEPSVFDFDPANPTPSVGFPLLFDNGPGRDESNEILATRSDVLTFDTEPLQQDVEVCGKPAIDLFHHTDRPNADLWIVLSDVDGRSGNSRSISEKYIRLPPHRKDDAIELRLTDCAHRFRKGNRIRLFIAGGCHPRYIRNLGTGEDSVEGVRMAVVRHTVESHAAAVSKLVLPVTSRT